MKTQWQFYKNLERLPDSLSEPQPIHSPFIVYLDRWMRSRLDRQARKLDYEYQVEYLERRLALNGSKPVSHRTFWRKLWSLLNRPLLLGRSLPVHPEPEIRQTLDQMGQKWWKVYDPLTGQTAYLESESDVQIWLEERLYY